MGFPKLKPSSKPRKERPPFIKITDYPLDNVSSQIHVDILFFSKGHYATANSSLKTKLREPFFDFNPKN